MNFESIPKKENSLQLILESVAEQLADEVESEVAILAHDVNTFVFQPQLVLNKETQQRVGPSEEFIDSFIKNMIVRLETMYPNINWKEGLTSHISSDGIVTIHVDFNTLNTL